MTDEPLVIGAPVRSLPLSRRDLTWLISALDARAHSVSESSDLLTEVLELRGRIYRALLDGPAEGVLGVPAESVHAASTEG